MASELTRGTRLKIALGISDLGFTKFGRLRKKPAASPSAGDSSQGVDKAKAT
jgi:hypothetical protein